MNRRKFLKLIGATLGVSTAACCGLGTLATYQPKIDLVENHHQGGSRMSKRILVAYASQAGSTGEVAAFMGKALGTNGITVDVCPIENVTNSQGYQAVVVGSAIRAGKWMPVATNFVETHQAVLSRIPTAYFTCCMTLHQDTPENRRKALSFMDPVREILEPVDIGAFAGKMDYRKISFLDRFMVTKVFSTPEGDFRNWDAIQTWVNNLQPKLLG
jgi:menaquinone-dependent protoporphyrinogen oxidase